MGGSTRIPAVYEIIKKMMGKELSVTVNPDEVVALGAAVQAGVLDGEVFNIVLVDVTPLSLGVGIHLKSESGLGWADDLSMSRVIQRNTMLPTSKSLIYTTVGNGQTSINMKVLQGERELACDNKSLGVFTINGLPSLPAGKAEIEVKFDMDANGILRVLATDKSNSNNQQSIKITGSSTLSKEEVDRMINEAEKYAGEAFFSLGVCLTQNKCTAYKRGLGLSHPCNSPRAPALCR